VSATAADFGRCDNPGCLKFCWIGVLKEHNGMKLCPRCWPHRTHISKGRPRFKTEAEEAAQGRSPQRN